jgi:membrane-associated phospholipid phosphatase
VFRPESPRSSRRPVHQGGTDGTETGYARDVGVELGTHRARHSAAWIVLVAALCSLPAESAVAQPVVGGVGREALLTRSPAARAAADPVSDTLRRLAPAFEPQPPARTLDQATSPAEPSAPAYGDYFHALGYSFTRGLFAREQLTPLAIGSVVALALSPVDRKLSDAVRGKADRLGRFGNVVGHPLTLGVISGGLILGSLGTDSGRFRGYAFTLSQGLIVAGSVATATKLVVRRPRPNGESKLSFPSGHAAVTFALAAVSSHYYGKQAGIPLFALASLVALSRVESGKHFPTDVVMGATVGYISGRAAIRGAQHVTAQPSGAGFRIYLTF